MSKLKVSSRLLGSNETQKFWQNDPPYGSEPLRSPAPVDQSVGIGEFKAGENARARLGDFFSFCLWPEPVILGRTDQTNGNGL